MRNNSADQSLIVYWDVEVVAQVPLEIFPAALLYYIGICQHKIDEEKVFHSLAGSERCSKYMRRGELQYHDDFGGDLVRIRSRQ